MWCSEWLLQGCACSDHLVSRYVWEIFIVSRSGSVVMHVLAGITNYRAAVKLCNKLNVMKPNDL